MTELSALNVRITGDASDLRAEMARASGDIKSVATQAQVAQVRAGGMATSLGRLGNVSNQTRARIQNTSFQLQDIAVQLQSGTRASTVFAQQLPQLLGGFGALGAVAGVLAGVGIPALAFAFSALGESAQTAEDKMKELEGAAGTLKAAQDILGKSVRELAEDYGIFAQSVRDAAAVSAQFAIGEVQRQLAGTLDVVNEGLDALSGRLARINSPSVQATQGVAVLNRELRLLKEEFGLTEDQAEALEGALIDVRDAATTQARFEAIERLKTVLADSAIETAKLPPELAAAITNAVSLTTQLAAMETQATRTAAEMAKIPAALSAGPTSRRGHRTGTTGLAPEESVRPMSREEGLFDEFFGAPDPAKRGGGAPKVNPLIRELEQVEQALMTQEELQLQSYMRQQETLQSALDQRLLTQQEYNELMQDAQAQHQDKMVAIDAYRYGTGLDKTEQFLGDMANALEGGNDKMIRIARVFGAAQALISTYQGAAKALELPFPQNIAAAASVIAKGMGFVSAIKNVSKSGGGGAGGSSAGAASAATAQAPAQQPNVQTLNFSVVNDPFGISDRVVRQIVGAINESQRNGSNLIRATVT